MTRYNTYLDLLIFEIRYAYGHLFWDRCGQTILDIEKQCDGWFSSGDRQNTGRMENPVNRMGLMFTDKIFNFNIRRPKPSDNSLIIAEIQKTWKIIKANFGLEDFDRVGFRIQYILPTSSIVESEKLIRKSELNVKIPKKIDESEYKITTQSLVTIFEKENVEYRTELKGIIRSESIDPDTLLKDNPRTMSKRQKEYRNLKIKQKGEYSENPMYAVMLDVDCVQYEPIQINIEKYFGDQFNIVETDFYPIIEKIK